jgi:hypothetical protein
MSLLLRQHIVVGLRATMRPQGACSFAAWLICGALLAVSAHAQQAQAPAASPPEPAAPASTQTPSSGSRPGFLSAFGDFISGSADAIGSGIKSTQDSLGNLGSQATGAAKDAASAAGGAAGAVLAVPGVVTGRQLCPLASNGAPDCTQGAVALCRVKGFQTGRHLEVMSARRCSVQAWWSGGKKIKNACRNETYVTRAVCQ